MFSFGQIITTYYISTNNNRMFIVFFLKKALENNNNWKIETDYFFNGNCKLNGVSDD